MDALTFVRLALEGMSSHGPPSSPLAPPRPQGPAASTDGCAEA